MIRFPALSLAAALCAYAMPSTARDTGPRALTVFGGPLLDNRWEEVFTDPAGLTVEDSYLVGLAGSLRLAEPVPGLSLEIEAQIVRHVHGQSHWEANLPVATARWDRFPWSQTLDTSAAFGLGLSIASETPAREAANEGASEAVMAYWMIELDAALPAEDWRLVGRLHHRSTAYGLFGDDGGSNALVLGLRRRF